MNERERLIELIAEKQNCGEKGRYIPNDPYAKILPGTPVSNKELADHLLANGVRVQRWIPVTERLPDIVETKRSYGNVYRSSGRVLCACLQADGKRMVKEGYMKMINDDPNPNWKIPGTIHSVTHWRPMPEPPKEEEV